ncbi:hypothetical protein H2248_010992 [Termitomyces sp. 'cryptogamus']|nr:hypothetical protein H2248_010992 [Termitomyces sp. 'cryptogamus']
MGLARARGGDYVEIGSEISRYVNFSVGVWNAAMNSDYPQRQQWPNHLLPDYNSFYARTDRTPASSLSLNLSSLSVASPPCPSPAPAISPSTPVSPSVYPYQFDPSYDDHRTPGPDPDSPRKRSTPVLEEDDLLYDEARDAPMELASDMDIRYTTSAAGTANGSPVDGSDGTSGPETDSNVSMGAVGASMNVLGKPLATNNFVTKLYQMISDAKSAHYIAWTELGTSFVVSNVGEFSRSILGSHFKHNNFSSFVRQLNMYGFHKINRTPRAQRTSTDAQTWEFSHHKFLRGRPDLLDEIKRKALEPDPAIKHRVELPGEVAAQLGAMRDENRRVWEQLNLERKRTDRLATALQRLWELVGSRMGGLSPFPHDLVDVADNPNIYVTSPGAQSGSASSGAPARFAPPPLSMNNVHMGSLHTMHSPNSNSPTQPDFSAPQQSQQAQAQQQSSSTPTGGPGAPPLSRQHSFQHVSYLRGDASPLPASPGSSTMDLYDEPDAPSRISTKRPRISTDDDLHPLPHHSHPHPHSHSHPHTHTHTHAGMHAHAHGSAPNSAHSDLPSIPPIVPPPSLSSPGQPLPRRPSRARSDSAPLGYGFGGMGLGGWAGSGRPRSGSARGVGVGSVSGLGGIGSLGVGNGGMGVGSGGMGVGMVNGNGRGVLGQGQGQGAGAPSGLGLGVGVGVQSGVAGR